MSSSQHPIALRLEQQVSRHVSGGTALLATVMCLPLLDGIFPALVLAGAVDSVAGIVQVGLLVFGGSATLAVILAEMDGTRRDAVRSVLLVGTIMLPLAALQAAIAPTIESLLNLVVFERFAALVILAVAAKTASARIGELLPRPAVIVGLGFIGSLDPNGASFTFVADPGLVVNGVAAASVGLAFALGVAVTEPWLRGVLDIDRFRFGSAIALGVLPFSILGNTSEFAPLAVLIVAGLLAYDPGGALGLGPESESEPDSDPEPLPESEDSAVADGGDDDGPEYERAPWL